MQKHFSSRAEKIGLPPGSLVYIGEPRAEKMEISVIDYGPEHIEMRTAVALQDIYPPASAPPVTWVDISGLHEVEKLRALSEHFAIHPLAMEDILNTQQRPKIEIFDAAVLIILRMVRQIQHTVEIEQVSLILGQNYLITFQKKPGDLFKPIRERLQNGAGRIRKRGPDYLAYAIIDLLVDHYFLVLETLGEQIETVEEDVLQNPERSSVRAIHRLKRELLELRRSIFPLREVASVLQQGESPLIKKSTGRFLKDLHDHVIQIIDSIETYREMVSAALELYLSMLSMKTNEVMKVLTIIATIFIPLSFLTGVYGMNFDTSISPFNLPELHARYGYPLFWLVSLLLAGAHFMYFKRKKWL